MQIKALKFGGSSLSDAEQFKKVRDIILSDPSRRYVVPSAPGKRFKEDDKVTDLLYTCYNLSAQGESFEEVFDKIVERYDSIVNELGVDLELSDRVGINLYGKLENLPENSYAVQIMGRKIIIIGSDDTLTVKSLKEF